MPDFTVKAEDVRVDDHLYMGDDFARNPNHRYARVRKVKRMRNHTSDRVWIAAGGRDLWFDPHDMVLVQRWN